MVILVLGGDGFVANAIKRFPTTEEIYFASRDLCDAADADALSSLIGTLRPSCVINLAAFVRDAEFQRRHPATMLVRNAEVALGVLKACTRCQVPRVVDVLSTDAHAKQFALALADALRRENKMEIVSVVPCNLYGPGMRRGIVADVLARVQAAGSEPASASWDMPGLEERKEETKGAVIRCCGDGRALHQLMLVDDFVECLLWAATTTTQKMNGRLIVAPEESISNGALAERIRDAVAPSARIEWDPSKARGHEVPLVDAARYRTLRPDARFTPLDEGLRVALRAATLVAPAPPPPPARLLRMFDRDASFPLCDERIDEKDRIAAIELLASGAKLSSGKHVSTIEHEFARFVGAKHAVFVNSGSSANLLALHAITVAPRHLRHSSSLPRIDTGDEILVPAVCWSTSVAPAVQLGLKPVLVDMDPRTLQICVEDLERKAARPGATALMLVHVLGPSADMDRVMRICRDNRVVLIEDACEVLGNTCGGKRLGTFGIMGTFSMCSIEGGFVVTNSDECDAVLRSTRSHGWTRDVDEEHLPARGDAGSDSDRRFHFVLPGFNVRNTEINAAIGQRQLARLPAMNRARTHNMRLLRAALALHPSLPLRIPDEPAWNGPEIAWLRAPILVDVGYDVARVKQRLEALGVETRPIIVGDIARQPFMRGVDGTDLPGADQIGERGFYINLHHSRWKVADVLQIAIRVHEAVRR